MMKTLKKFGKYLCSPSFRYGNQGGDGPNKVLVGYGEKYNSASSLTGVGVTDRLGTRTNALGAGKCICINQQGWIGADVSFDAVTQFQNGQKGKERLRFNKGRCDQAFKTGNKKTTNVSGCSNCKTYRSEGKDPQNAAGVLVGPCMTEECIRTSKLPRKKGAGGTSTSGVKLAPSGPSKALF